MDSNFQRRIYKLDALKFKTLNSLSRQLLSQP